MSVPKQDYNSMPLLAAPPQVGQRIAFKVGVVSCSHLQVKNESYQPSYCCSEGVLGLH